MRKLVNHSRATGKQEGIIRRYIRGTNKIEVAKDTTNCYCEPEPNVSERLGEKALRKSIEMLEQKQH